MARRRPWYETLFERDYYDYFSPGGPRGQVDHEEYEQRTDEEVDFVIDALGLKEDARVLDLCCGWGRHAVRLAQRGYHVTGLDLSAQHLRIAGRAARAAGVEVDWVRADMRDVPRRRRFDAVVNLFTSFGYFDTADEDQRVLKGVVRTLKPGGRFLLDTMNQPRLMRIFRESDWHDTPDGGTVLERRRYEVRSGRIENEWVYVSQNGRRRRHAFSHRLYTCSELEAMLSNAGLTVRGVWGGFDGSALTRESARLIVLAERG